ncbi:hypothetical protein Tco_1579500, partial [Tanacetum coccineum]
DKRLREGESMVLHEYNAAISDEEKFRNHRNRVNVVHDEKGRRFEGDKVGDQFVKHFKQFLGKSVPVSMIQDIDKLFKVKLNQEEAMSKIKDVSDVEIKKAMFQINDNKAPGPNGFSSHFYKKDWKIVREDVCIVVREFFTNGKILSEINSTIIALVPKIQTPAKVFDYRPIACCNVIYKCISKILTKRMKKGLGKLASQNQSTFIPQRQI